MVESEVNKDEKEQSNPIESNIQGQVRSTMPNLSCVTSLADIEGDDHVITSPRNSIPECNTMPECNTTPDAQINNDVIYYDEIIKFQQQR